MGDTIYIIGIAEGKECLSDVSGSGITPGDPGRARQVLMDLSSNLFSVPSEVIPASIFAFTCYVFRKGFLRTGKWTSLIWMISEGMVVLRPVIRRESYWLSRNP
jgi:hypothetical protein